jgi:thiol:disulfide interchange protein
MKKSSLLVALVVLCAAALVAVSSQAQKQEASEIQWLTDMGTALQRAKSENKPILLDFFNPN